jgi:aspyridone synthetase trans-acting enoyl reductase
MKSERLGASIKGKSIPRLKLDLIIKAVDTPFPPISQPKFYPFSTMTGQTLTLPSTQRAVKVVSAGKVSVQDDCPLPTLQPDEILIRVHCVSLNPADGKSADLSPTPGATSGCDFSGEVASLGEVSDNGLQVGTRVCGCVFGNNPFRADNGAFAEYVAAPARLVFRIPNDMDFQTAATLGTGIATTGLALYQELKLPLPSEPAEKFTYVLVNGGGTATGAIAIQMLKL